MLEKHLWRNVIFSEVVCQWPATSKKMTLPGVFSVVCYCKEIKKKGPVMVKMLEKHLWRIVVLGETVGDWPATSLKIKFPHSCFLVVWVVKG